jgi:hypothetical protein
LKTLNPPERKSNAAIFAAAVFPAAVRDVSLLLMKTCNILKSGTTQALQLVLYNVPYSARFITFCVAQFREVSVTAYGYCYECEYNYDHYHNAHYDVSYHNHAPKLPP